MVREARFAWGRHRPLPTELINRDWDSGDDESAADPAPTRRRPHRDPSPRQDKKSSPERKSRQKGT